MLSDKRQFYFFLSNLSAFHFFFLSDCTGYNLQTILSRKNKGRHFHLAPDHMGKSFFSSLNTMLPIQLSQIFYIRLRRFLSISHLLRDFNQEWVLGFLTWFFYINWGESEFFFGLLMRWITDFWMLYPFCIPGINPTWSCYIKFFSILELDLLKFCLKVLHRYPQGIMIYYFLLCNVFLQFLY